ncbi:hypothetical protein [Saccharopolyspora shandongensis]|uniref:hypothetical protein n=1 Tax=Saccharopolyspora shandongensis TaxID=418495 RepID=UPI0033FD77EA
MISAHRKPLGILGILLSAASLVIVGAALPAQAAGESVDIWLTTTSDPGGRVVTRGLDTTATFTWGGAATHTVSADGGEAAALPVGATRRDGRRRAA